MAKAKKTTAQRVTVSRSSGQPRNGGAVVVVREGAAKVARTVRRAASRARPDSDQATLLGLAMGGYGVGFVEKHFGDQLPNLPIVGRKGAIALAVYFLKPKNTILRNVGKAAAALSGYQFAKEGKIDGDEDDD
jgi:hypothetical protein